MPEDRRDLDAARAALADPRTTPDQLLALCLAQPSLGAEAAMHAAADRPLLGWLAKWEDPVTAATAQARLALLPGDSPVAPAHPAAGPAFAAASGPFSTATPGQPGLVTPAGAGLSAPVASVPPSQGSGAPGARPAPRPGTRRRLVIGGIAAVVALALAATGVFVVLPWLTGRGGTYNRAPDFREQPGILAVDAIDGLPTTGGQTWSTSFTPVSGTGMALAYNWTSAFRDYQEQLSAYNEAAQAYQAWESAYTAGYADGKSCMAATVDLTWYSSKQDYCYYHSGDYANTSTSGGDAGFTDATHNLPSTPANPGASMNEPPEVPAKPQPPTTGDNLVGIDLKTGKMAWKLDLGSVWPGVNPSGWVNSTDAGRTLLVLSDPAAEEGTADRMLVVVDDRTGKATAGKPTDGADLTSATLVGDLVVVADSDDNLRALNATDLATQVWTSPARALAMSGEENPYWLTPPPGYLLTQDGYIKVADGTKADFARDAGQDGIQLTVLEGTRGDLIRVEPRDAAYDVSGFNSGSNSKTWRLDGLSAMPRKAGGHLLAVEKDEVTAYRINGSEIEDAWRYSCTDQCVVTFADDQRVFVEDLGRDEFVILRTSDGTRLDRVRDVNSGYPTVGTSVVYLQTQNRIVAYDLEKSGTPTLWRSREVGGWLAVFDGSLVLIDSSSGRLGIIGLDADDWNSFKPTDE